MKKKLTLFAILATVAIIAILCSDRGLPYKEINSQWANQAQVVRINDGKEWSLIGEPSFHEFSSDSKYFAVWDHDGDFHKTPYICIWDLEGNKVPDAIDNTKLFMKPEYRRIFNKCALREAPHLESSNGKYSQFTPYPHLARYAIGWFISPDWKYMVTFGNAEFEKWLKEIESNQNSTSHYPGLLASNIEIKMWQLEPNIKQIWENAYRGNSYPNVGCFYSQGLSLYLLII